jgi:hypothetical protein
MTRWRLPVLIALVWLGGCGGPSDAGDNGAHCAALLADDCAKDKGCQFASVCCDSPATCMPRGSLPSCPVNCDPCSGLSESACKADSRCRANYCDRCQCAPGFSSCTLASDKEIPSCWITQCPVPSCTCQGLDEASCNAAPPTLHCWAHTCWDCHGDPIFGNCGDPGSDPDHGACPVCPPACNYDTDCPAGQRCQPPAGPVMGSCTVTSDCAEGGACVAGMCVPQSCSAASDCPNVNFDCVVPPLASGGECLRVSCQQLGCPIGACVDGACYSYRGACVAP